MSAPTSNLSSALIELKRRAAILGVELNAQQAKSLEVFCLALEEYNQHTNLVARTDADSLVLEHILDAWSLLAFIDDSAGTTLVDIGSGAGFPGLILAIAKSELKVVLIESIGKKVRFLEQAASLLGIGNRVKVLNDRAEISAHQQNCRATFNYATARAVSSLDVVCELALPFLKKGGIFLAQKSARQLQDERCRAEKALPHLGGKLEQVVSIDLQAVQKDHVILLIKKVSDTPPTYPRTPTQIKRHPLGE